MKIKKYEARKGLFGVTLFYDKAGNKVGEGRPIGLLEKIEYYDICGKKWGYSENRPLGIRQYYDAYGNKVGTSGPGMLGTVVYYDNSGRQIGISEPTILEGFIYYDTK